MMSAKEYLQKNWTGVRVVIALAKHDMNAQAAADAIYVHRNTINYHARKMRENTGLNPLKFYDLCELLPVAKELLEKEG